MSPPSDRSTPLLRAFVAVVVALPLVHAGAVVALLGTPQGTLLAHELAGWAGSLLGVAGTLLAVRAFSPGDYLHRAWRALAAGAALLLVGTALRTWWAVAAPGEPFLASPLLPWRMGVIVAANAVSLYALALLASAYARAGLSPPRSWRASVLWALGGAAALAVALPQLRLDLARLQEGGAASVSAVTSLASTLGDFGTIVLIVPLLRVAYMLRGGRLASVWWVMGLSGCVWLVYDVRSVLAGLTASPEVALELLRVTRSPGLALVGLAGALQAAALTAAVPAPRGTGPALGEPA